MTNLSVNLINIIPQAQVRWLMGAPAGLKLHAELAALLGGAMLAALHALAAPYAWLVAGLPLIVGELL